MQMELKSPLKFSPTIQAKSASYSGHKIPFCEPPKINNQGPLNIARGAKTIIETHTRKIVKVHKNAEKKI